jgi:hypothetical protein
VVALLAIGVIVGLVTLFHGKRPIGSENLIGKQLPDFAVPLAGSGIDGDANIYTPQEATANKATAACNVRIKGSINSCDGLKGAAVLLFWNSSKTECVKQVDQLQAALAKHPKVNALAVASSDSMQTVTEWQKNKHWKLPIAVDPDGAASTLYSAPGCPSIFFAQDGKITGVKLGLQSSAQLSAEIAKNTNG